MIFRKNFIKSNIVKLIWVCNKLMLHKLNSFSLEQERKTRAKYQPAARFIKAVSVIVLQEASVPNAHQYQEHFQ